MTAAPSYGFPPGRSHSGIHATRLHAPARRRQNRKDRCRSAPPSGAARLLTQRGDDWLALYEADATFWIPAWIDRHAQSASPDAELSLIYCAARAGLEDRVWRIRSGLSAASTPLLRTAHAVSCPVVSALEGAGPARLRVESSWTCHVHHPKRREEHVFFGRCEHVLREGPHGWRIAAKKVVLMNDTIPTMLDFYCV